MKAYEVIGYALDGEITCPDCTHYPDDSWPIFTNSESDSPDACAVCGFFIPVTLTTEGIKYAKSLDRRKLNATNKALFREYWPEACK